jgi:hypothetical protein
VEAHGGQDTVWVLIILAIFVSAALIIGRVYLTKVGRPDVTSEPAEQEAPDNSEGDADE